MVEVLLSRIPSGEKPLLGAPEEATTNPPTAPEDCGVMKSATGGARGSITSSVISSKATRAPSLAVKRKIYLPGTLNCAAVIPALGSAKATSPGPLTWDQITDKLLPKGRPSSVISPLREAAPGNVIVWSAPA